MAAARFLIVLTSLVAVMTTCHALYGGLDPDAEAAWLSAFPRLALPSSLLLEESPLPPLKVGHWASRLETDGHTNADLITITKEESSDLCSHARLACIPTPRVRGTLPDDINYLPGDWIIYAVDAPAKDVEPIVPGRFFRLHQLYPQATMIFPDLNHPVTSLPYLPYAIAKHLPLTPSSIPLLLTMFGLSNSSSMGYVLNNIVQRCSLPFTDTGMVQKCSISIEDMISFVVERLGTSVEVLESQPTPRYLKNTTSNMVVKTVVARPRDDTLATNVVCHKLLFPSMLRGCHELTSTKVYEAQFQIDGDADNHLIYAVALCHFDTSKWHANHPAFKLLGASPGEGEICHWVRADEHVWVHT